MPWHISISLHQSGAIKAEGEMGRGGEGEKKMRSTREKAPLRMTAFFNHLCGFDLSNHSN
jgi:hypothetical protein